jgi:hypothetical protein
MSPRTPYTFAAAAVVSGVAGLALATPAAAMVDPAPPPASEVIQHTQHGGSLTETPTVPTSVTEDDSPWAEIGVAAVGGLAIAGVAIGASVAVRRRSVAHPA